MKKRNQKDLGPLIARYPVQPLRWQDLFLTFLPLIVVVLAPLGYGLWRTYYGYTNFGPAAARFWGRPWFLTSGFLVLFLLGYSLRRLIRAHCWVEVHPQGLLVQRSSGRALRIFWKEIWGVTSYAIHRSFFGLLSNTRRSLILYPFDGKPIKIHQDLKGIKGLTKTVKKEVYRRIYPAFSRALKIGKQVPFGEMTITRDRLIYRNREIPWRFIAGLSVGEGKLMIQLSEEQEISVPVKDLQNIELLIHFIETEIS